MKFLGTSAGEGVPNPFCTCRICENARKVGGKEIRTRSSLMLDETTMIDMSADYFSQAITQGVSFDKVEHLLFTHMHDDHLNPMLFWERSVRDHGAEQTMHVYCSDEAASFFSDFYLTAKGVGHPSFLNGVEIHPLLRGQTYEIGSYKVTPLWGQHTTDFEKQSTNYLLENNGKKMYYALDSGYFPEDTFAALANQKLDLMIMECTRAYYDPETMQPRAVHSMKAGHNDLAMCIKTLDRLLENGGITPNTRIILTHISAFEVTHAEFCELVTHLDRPYAVEVAYDGMELDI